MRASSKKFPKSEKLCGKLRVKALYDNGRHFTCYPLRVTYIVKEDTTAPASASSPCHSDPQILIWAPKSLFRHAVDRNRLRRQMREAYRLSAAPLREYAMRHNLNMHVAFNYIANEQLQYSQIEKAVRKAINKLTEAEARVESK